MEPSDLDKACRIPRAVERMEPSANATLAVEVPLAAAEACLFLGEIGHAQASLVRARSAIVGLTLPELDLRIEVASAQLAAATGDMLLARHHLHRALSLRGHIADQASPPSREAFFAAPRWRGMAALEQRFALSGSALVAAPAAARREPESLGFVANSAAMKALLAAIGEVAPKELSVLVRGPTGSGKDLVAKAIHRASARARGPFVAIHCPSLQPQLIEAELFGFVRGAFTGAEDDRAGLLQCAEGGTVFFDEVSALETAAQAKLLRAVDARLIRPVGGTDSTAIDARFVFGTTEDLRSLAEQGRFRNDLYWRIAQVELVVPPLRERREDVPELARLFLEKHAAQLGRAAAGTRVIGDVIRTSCEAGRMSVRASSRGESRAPP